ncbi:hypothetical protein ACEQ38_19545 [Ralstonia syzygii subsp. celebesensis]|uniref:hypothetical protein n=1 Tax=Ralstonia syzygii TaxID=28097 RepID=UPI003511F583
MARKGDGKPGAKTIWKGLQQVMTATETLRALRRETAWAECMTRWGELGDERIPAQLTYLAYKKAPSLKYAEWVAPHANSQP